MLDSSCLIRTLATDPPAVMCYAPTSSVAKREGMLPSPKARAKAERGPRVLLASNSELAATRRPLVPAVKNSARSVFEVSRILTP